MVKGEGLKFEGSRLRVCGRFTPLQRFPIYCFGVILIFEFLSLSGV